MHILIHAQAGYSQGPGLVFSTQLWGEEHQLRDYRKRKTKYALNPAAAASRSLLTGCKCLLRYLNLLWINCDFGMGWECRCKTTKERYLFLHWVHSLALRANHQNLRMLHTIGGISIIDFLKNSFHASHFKKWTEYLWVHSVRFSDEILQSVFSLIIIFLPLDKKWKFV